MTFRLAAPAVSFALLLPATAAALDPGGGTFRFDPKDDEKAGVADRIGPEEHDIFVDYLTNEGARPSLDLQDEKIRESKLAGLFALILQSPAFQLH